MQQSNKGGHIENHYLSTFFSCPNVLGGIKMKKDKRDEYGQKIKNQ